MTCVLLRCMCLDTFGKQLKTYLFESASKRVEALAIADYRSPRNATRSRN